MADNKPGSYGIYFTANKKAVRIPVNPQTITVMYPGESSQYNVTDIGEIILPRLPKLATVEFESFFPRVDPVRDAGDVKDVIAYNPLIASESLYSPSDYVEFFTRLMRNKTIVDFTINRFDGESPMFDTSFRAIITDFKITENGGESGDIYYSISVSEYREAKPSLIETKSETTNAQGDTLIELVELKQRPRSPDEITVGDKVTVNGKTYNTEDESEITWEQARGYVSFAVGTVLRVLPPEVRRTAHSVYVQGIGWTDYSSCVKGNKGGYLYNPLNTGSV